MRLTVHTCMLACARRTAVSASHQPVSQAVSTSFSRLAQTSVSQTSFSAELPLTAAPAVPPLLLLPLVKEFKQRVC